MTLTLLVLVLAGLGLLAWWFWCQVQGIHDLDDLFDPEDDPP